MRFVDTKPNGEALRKCILQGPYKLSNIKTPEKEAIHLLLIGIGDEIYSTVDACKTAHDIFTSRDGESNESYYSRFYKMMNEMVRNQLEVTTMQVNVQFLQQLQPEWSRFVTLVKHTQELDTIARNANPLALVAAAQQYPDPYYQAPKSYKSYVPPSKQSSSTISHATTKYKGKEIAKPITPPSKSASEEDSDPKQAQRDKDMTSSNSKNKNVDTTPRYVNENQTGQFGNQRTLTVVRAWETVGTDWLEDTDEEIDEEELEAYYSFMAKIQGVLHAESGSDAEPLEKVQFNAKYNVFANERQHYDQPEFINDTHVVEKDDSNVIPNSSMCDNDNQADQNAKECDDEHVVFANLIANLKLDTDKNKKIQKKLKKANTSLSHEL
ncbi:hypothetical protein Tco_0810731 [Tanacetum coccineum]